MKKLRVAINGFGRIGRNFLRTVMADPQASQFFEVVAINIGPANKDSAAHMFNYDTLMGTFSPKARLENNYLIIGEHSIEILSKLNPLELEWKRLAIDLVIESSGFFTKSSEAKKHIEAGAGYVLITAPAKDDVVTIIPGINEDAFDPQRDKIISLGSCTTNAFLPLLKVLNDHLAIQAGFMTTVHAYTNSQVLIDVEHKDLRRSRAAALNIIPTTTGAAKLVDKIIPQLAGKIQAQAMRVPVAKVSIIDLTINTQTALTVDMVNELFKTASSGSLKGIMNISFEPLVSSDYSGNPYSVVVDGLMTQVIGTMANVYGWYDNEWGYSCRLKDFARFLAKKL